MEPKANAPNQREMTCKEKHELSKNMQNLPPEKFEEAFAIIVNGIGTALLSNPDSEGSIDSETFWELHRYVADYKKTVTRKKRTRSEGHGMMTDEQKQKLSDDLASLNSEIHQEVIDIFKKRSATFGEYKDNDDVFEVDLDIIDEETLSELQRFVTSYKKIKLEPPFEVETQRDGPSSCDSNNFCFHFAV